MKRTWFITRVSVRGMECGTQRRGWIYAGSSVSFLVPNTPPPPISMGMGWDGMFFYTGARPVRERERERERDGMNRTLPNLPALSRSIDDDEYNTSRKRKDPTSTGTQPPPPFPQKEPHRHWFGLPHEGPQPSCLLMETTVLCLLTFIYLCHC